MALLVVKAAFDQEAAVWCVLESDVPGLAAEAASFDELCDKIRIMVPELLDANDRRDGSGGDGIDVPLEIIAHQASKVRLARAA